MEQLILNLFDVGCIKFGKFTLKSRVVSLSGNFKAVSYPEMILLIYSAKE